MVQAETAVSQAITINLCLCRVHNLGDATAPASLCTVEPACHVPHSLIPVFPQRTCVQLEPVKYTLTWSALASRAAAAAAAAPPLRLRPPRPPSPFCRLRSSARPPFMLRRSPSASSSRSAWE